MLGDAGFLQIVPALVEIWSLFPLWNPEPDLPALPHWLARLPSTSTTRHPLIGHEHALNRALDISQGLVSTWQDISWPTTALGAKGGRRGPLTRSRRRPASGSERRWTPRYHATCEAIPPWAAGATQPAAVVVAAVHCGARPASGAAGAKSGTPPRPPPPCPPLPLRRPAGPPPRHCLPPTPAPCVGGCPPRLPVTAAHGRGRFPPPTP